MCRLARTRRSGRGEGQRGASAVSHRTERLKQTEHLGGRDCLWVIDVTGALAEGRLDALAAQPLDVYDIGDVQRECVSNLRHGRIVLAF
jgi:hypothetical protein